MSRENTRFSPVSDPVHVQEEDAMVGQGDFAGGGVDVADEQAGVAGGVVRGAEGAARDEGRQPRTEQHRR